MIKAAFDIAYWCFGFCAFAFFGWFVYDVFFVSRGISDISNELFYCQLSFTALMIACGYLGELADE